MTLRFARFSSRVSRYPIEILEDRVLLAAQGFLRLNSAPAFGKWMKISAVTENFNTTGTAGTLDIKFPLNANTARVISALGADTSFTGADLQIENTATDTVTTNHHFSTVTIAEVDTSGSDNTVTETATLNFASEAKRAAPTMLPKAPAAIALNGGFFAETVVSLEKAVGEVSSKQQNPVFALQDFSFSLKAGGQGSILNIKKFMDDASEVAFDELINNGQVAFDLYVRSKSQSSLSGASAFAKFSFTNTAVTNVSWTGTSGDNQVTETDKIAFSGVVLAMSQTASDGTVTGPKGTITPPTSIVRSTAGAGTTIKPAITKLTNAVTTAANSPFLQLNLPAGARYHALTSFSVGLSLENGKEVAPSITVKDTIKANSKTPLLRDGVTFAGGAIVLAASKTKKSLAEFNFGPLAVHSVTRTTTNGQTSLVATLVPTSVTLKLLSALAKQPVKLPPSWSSLTSPKSTITSI